ncbi:hypothetical protein EON67_03670 [archaeon]|nr:MAG: hypothetical protein EON67_03670 [archaeon]
MRAHWKFLRTVVVKLFEFMHEKHPGVQDMAVETFLKIAQSCKRKFVQIQMNEQMMFIEELCTLLPTIISDLESHQVHTFYEAAGQMVSAHPDEATRDLLTERLMALPQAMWTRLVSSAAESLDNLQSVDQLKELQRVLRTNVAACRSIGPSFAKQLGRMYLDMLNVYKVVSHFLVSNTAAMGPNYLQSFAAKCMIAVKKETLTLIVTYVTRATDPAFVATHFVPPLLEPVLCDYAAALPAAREVEVLNLMTAIIVKLQRDALAETPRILNAVIEPTLSLIITTYHEYPEHRLAFFKLLEAVNTHVFEAVFMLPPAQQKMIVDAVVWAISHHSPEVSDTALAVMDLLVKNFEGASPEVCMSFFDAYYLQLLHEILKVLTDRMHKAQLKTHVQLLRHMCELAQAPTLTVSLWMSPYALSTGARASFESLVTSAGPAAPPVTNATFVQHFISSILSAAFPHVSAYVARSPSFVHVPRSCTRHGHARAASLA